MTRRCEEAASFARTVKAAGLSCLDYTLVNIIIMQASILSLGVEQRGEAFLQTMPGGATARAKANIRFVTDNKAEIGKLISEQRKLIERQ